ncbi:MAG TPA: trehalose-6-phosphate synthase [Thermoplasmata archaeon]|nr:trehalose-6-phosphate synthase [Thermoplasmata archaeon]
MFVGAAREMEDALLVNPPYDTGRFARAIKEVIEMKRAKKRRGWKK